MENVDDHLQVIEHNPLARRETVHRDRANSMILLKSRFNLAGDGFELWLGAGRADDEEIREGGDFSKIQNDDVFRLFVRGEFGAGLC